MQQTILVAEDDKDIAALLRLYLQNEGYAVLTAENGVDALRLVTEQPVQLAILDVMMPRMDGYELTQRIRAKSNLPILMLSAKNSDNDKILGLGLGADDYLAKPFNPMEVIARVKAALRRCYDLSAPAQQKSVLEVGALQLDTEAVRACKNGAELLLTPTEYKLLAVLMREPGRVFTKAQLYERISGDYYESDDNTMMVHISKLREKLEDDPKNPRYIITVRGLGYKLETQETTRGR